MATNNITYNLNEIINTKNEFQDILRENGINPGTVFSEYPSQIRSIIGSGGGGSIDEATINSYISTYLTTYNFIDQTELSANSYITEVVFNNGTGDFITSIQNSTSGGQHIILYNRGEAVTPSALASMGYITSSDVSAMGYITAAAIDNNLIPKENKTYTLGDSTYQYASVNTYSVGAYNSNMYIDTAHGIGFNINGSNRVYIGNSQFRPLTDNLMNLGLSSARWKATYTAYLYCNVDGVSTDIGYYLSYNLSGIETLLANI